MEHLQVAIIGAGPSGLQMGYYLKCAGIKYRIFEADRHPAGFFRKYPVTRTLISYNKHFNLYEEKSYNLRFDWNSLLNADDEMFFPNYSNELYPNADDLVRYLCDFASRLDLDVCYDCRVRIRRAFATGGFQIVEPGGCETTCDLVLVATGAVAENIPDIKGIEHAHTYGTFLQSEAAKNLKGKEICIIGGGVSANEIARELRERNEVALVRLHMRSPIRQASQTHFTGDVRARDFDPDVWQFELLHFWAESQVREIKKRDDGRFTTTMELPAPHWTPPRKLVVPVVYDHVIVCAGWRYVDPDLFEGFTIATHNGYDHCDNPRPGPEPGKLGRLPQLDEWWSTSCPGVFFIGSAAQVNDQVSSSPFIRGIRYTVRTLFEYLMETHFRRPRLRIDALGRIREYFQGYNGDPLPDFTAVCTTLKELYTYCVDISWYFSLTDSLPAMRSVFCDVIIFDEASKSFTWKHDLPIHAVVRGHEEAQSFYCERTDTPRPPTLTRGHDACQALLEEKHTFILTMEYGRNNYHPSPNAIRITKPTDHFDSNCSYYLHPVVRYFSEGQHLATVALQESLYGRFADRDDYEGFYVVHPNRLYNFFLRCFAGRVWPDAEMKYELLVPADQLDSVYEEWTEEDKEYWSKHKSDIQPKCLYIE